ncbi:hypothetical protein niasHT_038921 [Heterodera trifolii]|uniref:Uncharacterized protein n=1 Tax=Heterodera trifolii TaxID=157864 RepID=A0ABD2IK34_9BILA
MASLRSHLKNHHLPKLKELEQKDKAAESLKNKEADPRQPTLKRIFATSSPDVEVRWNSTYLMVSRFLENKSAIEMMPAQDAKFPCFTKPLQEVERVALSGIDEERETTDGTTNLEFTEENDDPFKAFLIEQSTSNFVFPSIPSPTPSLIDTKAKAAGQVADYLNSALFEGASAVFGVNQLI